MKLFLASEGSNPQTTKKLEEYVGGFNGKSVVYIPTARNGNGTFNTWKDSETWEFLNASGMEVKALELEDYGEKLDKNLFGSSNIIWFSGGMASYLMYWILRSSFDLMLPELLKESIYVGSSAGSMVTGPNLDVCEWYLGEAERGAKYLPALNLVDFDIYPHYEDALHDQIKKLYKGKKLYLLKDGEEIIVEDDKVTVIGEERIITND